MSVGSTDGEALGLDDGLFDGDVGSREPDRWLDIISHHLAHSILHSLNMKKFCCDVKIHICCYWQMMNQKIK